MKKQIIFNIAGGLGKNIMATSVIRALNEKYPDREIIIVSPYHQVWQSNPRVARIIKIENEPYFYRDFILNTDSLIFNDEPYLTEDFIYKRKHLTEIWCEMCKVEFSSYKPELYFTESEKNKVLNLLPKDKPTFFIQTNGGSPDQQFPISWARDLPISIVNQVVSEMNKKGYKVFHLRRPDQIAIEGAERLEVDFREALCAIQFSNKRLFIDSFAHHAANAFDLHSVVTWIANESKVFGYKEDINLTPKVPRGFRHYVNSQLELFNITGDPYEFPYETIKDLFSVEEILEKLEEIKENKI